MAKNSDSEQYLMISFDSKKTITSIVTMGKQNSSEFVEEFRILYSVDGGNFTECKDEQGNTKVSLLSLQLLSLCCCLGKQALLPFCSCED